MEKISWEAVLIDDCQSSRVSKCLGQLKRLPTNFRMVLLSSPIKVCQQCYTEFLLFGKLITLTRYVLQENIPEYINLLSFLSTEENDILSDSNGYSGDTAGTLSALKAKLARYIAFERKADSSIFSEYWVPARLSQVQLEMYCYILLSNSPALRSHSKTDSVGALRNILVSLRKVCFQNFSASFTIRWTRWFYMYSVAQLQTILLIVISSRDSPCCMQFIFFTDIQLILCYSAVTTLILLINRCKTHLPRATLSLISQILECIHVASCCFLTKCSKS